MFILIILINELMTRSFVPYLTPQNHVNIALYRRNVHNNNLKAGLYYDLNDLTKHS